MEMPLRLLAQIRLLLGQGPAAGLQSPALAMSMPGTSTAESLIPAPSTLITVSQTSMCCLTLLGKVMTPCCCIEVFASTRDKL